MFRLQMKPFDPSVVHATRVLQLPFAAADAHKRIPIIKYMHAKTKFGKPSRKNVILMQDRFDSNSRRTSVHVFEMLKSIKAAGLYGVYYRWPLTPIHTFALACVLSLF